MNNKASDSGMIAPRTQSSQPPDARPTDPSDRIVSLDALRGFALLGILVINMWYFSMPLAGAVLPPTYGDFSGVNYLAWLVGNVFFEMKFVALFTVMFGAGIILFTQSKEQKGQAAFRLHYRRTFLLLLIGLGHAYVLWYGDILVSYALCGLVVVFAKDWAPKRLVWVGVAMVAIPSIIYLVSSGVVLGLGDASTVSDVEDGIEAELGLSEAAMTAEIDAYRGGWNEQLEHRIPTAFSQHSSQFFFWNFWHLGGLMLIGMALFKKGILSNDHSRSFYRRVLIYGMGIGLATTLAGVWYSHVVEWSMIHVLLLSIQFTYWGSLPLAAAYIAGVMLWCQWRPSGLVTTSLAAVGRTAFSNYLLQTVIATTVFYGHGLGLFGGITRIEGLALVVVIWAIQIPLSVIWLRYFRFGPVEWIWRTLTYGNRQPLRSSN